MAANSCMAKWPRPIVTQHSDTITLPPFRLMVVCVRGKVAYNYLREEENAQAWLTYKSAWGVHDNQKQMVITLRYVTGGQERRKCFPMDRNTEPD